MSYIALRFDADAADADAWGDALLAAGALSVEASDPAAGTPQETPQFAEPGVAAPDLALWPVSRLTALLPGDADAPRVLASAADTMQRPLPRHATFVVAETDWVRATQSQFAPIRIAERLWIVPSWSEAPDPRAINLALDPGLAFGTGSHPSTRLCLRWLAAELRAGESVLDYGCGSGILAIAAAKLGAARVVGTDVDPQAIDASRANASRNGVTARFVLPDGLPEGQVDVIVANILANPLRLLAPALAARVRAGGRILLSGILAAQADDVAAAYAPWFNMARWRDDDEGWVALAGTRHGGSDA